MKFDLLMNIVIGSLFLCIGFVILIINIDVDIMAINPFWTILVFTLIAVGGYNIGTAIAKVNKLSK